MIKLFNKIRKQLLDENKTRRYLKYAIGEIILVMIGILLALQVNNWNQERQLQKEEVKILKGLHQEFSENLVRFDDIYAKQESRWKSIETLMSIKPKEFSLDSLTKLTKRVGDQYTFDPFQGMYNSIINSGKIELISNDSLKKKISRFQDLLNDYKEEEINTMNFTANNFYPFIINNSAINFNFFYNKMKMNDEEKIKYKEELIKRIESDTYGNLLIYIYGYMREIFTEGPILKEEMVSIISLLESDIEKHN
jgi:hypothetical protein